MLPPRLTLTFPSFRTSRPGIGLLVSLFLHALAVGLIVWQRNRLWESPPAAGSPLVPLSGAAGGGSGGGRVAYITLPPASVPAASHVPRVVPPAPPKPEPRVAPTPSAAPPPAVDTSAAEPTPPADARPSEVRPSDVPPGADTGASRRAGGVGIGAGAGTGQGNSVGPGAGTGAGRGPGAGGEGGRGTPPESRQLVVPPSDYPKALRGRTLEVTFWVDAAGQVQRIRVVPEINDREFAKQFAEAMRSYRFRPARSPEGAPVPGSITVQVAF